jgi:ABC-type Fe3+/spermidine/putrescine transport system ATPase subunit
MTAVAIAALTVALGRFRLEGISLVLRPGEILVVLGPNGAGKSVLLETIAGFHRAARGTIQIAGRDAAAMPPERRRIGFLVQNFGLFPHLSVARNIALGARAGGADVAGLLTRFGIAHLANARPLVLSPGEKQRTALARALASRPDLFLLDEPFAALDLRARDDLRFELGRFLRAEKTPALFVTHDRTDAAALGDRVAVIDGGRILQLDGAAAIFRRPATRRVAEILGFENLLAGRIAGADGAAVRVAVGGATLRAASGGFADEGAAAVAIRAEDVRLAPEGAVGHADNRLSGAVIAIQPLGALSRVTLDCGFPLAACLMTRDLEGLGLAPGGRVAAAIDASDIILLAP